MPIKKNPQKAKDANLTMVASVLSFLAMGLGGAAIAVPSWYTVAPIGVMMWNIRYIGILKLGGMFTDVMTTPADMAWSTVKVALCNAAAAYGGTMGATSLTAYAGAALMKAGAGVSCLKPGCSDNLFTRCYGYQKLMYLNFGVAGMLAVGSMITLIGAAMPYFGKEKKDDKMSNFYVMISGALIAAAGPLSFYFFTDSLYASIRKTSWYPPLALGPAFFMAVGCAGLCLLASLAQLSKAMAKEPVKAVAGAAGPAELDPKLIDPTLL